MMTVMKVPGFKTSCPDSIGHNRQLGFRSPYMHNQWVQGFQDDGLDGHV